MRACWLVQGSAVCDQCYGCQIRLLLEIRKWVDTRGGGGPFPDAEALPIMKQEDAIDRYHQHTKNCPSCSGVGALPLYSYPKRLACGTKLNNGCVRRP